MAITIIIGTRTQSALRAAVNMAMQDGRRFDVVAPRESLPSVHVQLVERNPSVNVWHAEPQQVKRGEIPLRIVAYAHQVGEQVFLACLRPDTDLILACCMPSLKSAAWLEKLMQQEGKMEGLRVVRLGEADQGARVSKLINGAALSAALSPGYAAPGRTESALQDLRVKDPS